jgi:hypothetical protein
MNTGQVGGCVCVCVCECVRERRGSYVVLYGVAWSYRVLHGVSIRGDFEVVNVTPM